MTPAEFGMLTEKEKMFIRKEHENKLISDTTWTRNAVLNAEANLNRKKHKLSDLLSCFLKHLPRWTRNITRMQ